MELQDAQIFENEDSEEELEEIVEETTGYQIDENRLDYAIDMFKKIVSLRSVQKGLPVRFDNGFLQQKNKKLIQAYNQGRKALALETWRKSDIGTGKIKKCVSRAFLKSFDLIAKYPLADPFQYGQIEEIEKTIYDFYIGFNISDEDVFNRLEFFIGRSINVIAYLFFLKDKSKYLPCKSVLFFDRFNELRIQTNCLTGTSWQQYVEYNQILQEIKDHIAGTWKVPVTLANTFSVVENLSLIKGLLDNEEAYRTFVENAAIPEYIEKNEKVPEEKEVLTYEQEEQLAEELSDVDLYRKALERSKKRVERKKTLVPEFYRDPNIKELAKRRAKGVCTLCGQTLDYYDRKGRPYLESHHIVPLEDDGPDSRENVAALCPNCHQRMHHLNDKRDVEYLKQKVKEQCKKEDEEYSS